MPCCVCVFRLGCVWDGSGQGYGASSGAWMVVTRAAPTAHEHHETQAVHLYPRIHCCKPREPSWQCPHRHLGWAGNTESVQQQSYVIFIHSVHFRLCCFCCLFDFFFPRWSRSELTSGTSISRVVLTRSLFCGQPTLSASVISSQGLMTAPRTCLLQSRWESKLWGDEHARKSWSWFQWRDFDFSMKPTFIVLVAGGHESPIQL